MEFTGSLPLIHKLHRRSVIATPELYCRIFVTKADSAPEFIGGLRISKKHKLHLLSSEKPGSYISIKDKGWIYTTHVFVLFVNTEKHGSLFAMYKDIYPIFSAVDYSSDLPTLEAIRDEFEALSKHYGVTTNTLMDIKTQLLLYSALLRIKEYESKMAFLAVFDI